VGKRQVGRPGGALLIDEVHARHPPVVGEGAIHFVVVQLSNGPEHRSGDHGDACYGDNAHDRIMSHPEFAPRQFRAADGTDRFPEYLTLKMN
jgi:hypothetical protein